MTDFNAGELKITVRSSDGQVVVSWLGKSRARDPGALLGPYFAGLVPKLVGSTLLVDFTKLEYMNSSTVTAIIDLIRRVEASGVATVLRYDRRLEWQSASFKAIETLVRTLRHTRVEASVG